VSVPLCLRVCVSVCASEGWGETERWGEREAQQASMRVSASERECANASENENDSDGEGEGERERERERADENVHANPCCVHQKKTGRYKD